MSLGALPTLATLPPVRRRVAPSSRRDDQSRETKHRLVRSTIELVGEVGWKRTTVERIAERAGVAKGTFFVHFKTKEGVVLALVQAQIDGAIAARDALLGSGAKGASAVDRLRTATMTLGVRAATNIELSRAVLIASLESREVGNAIDAVFMQLHARMIEDAEEALAEGLLEGPDAETVAGLLMAGYLGAALHCTSTARAKPLAEVLAPLVDATLAALAPKRRVPRSKKKVKARGATR